jgi:hypothetical protein
MERRDLNPGPPHLFPNMDDLILDHIQAQSCDMNETARLDKSPTFLGLHLWTTDYYITYIIIPLAIYNIRYAIFRLDISFFDSHSLASCFLDTLICFLVHSPNISGHLSNFLYSSRSWLYRISLAMVHYITHTNKLRIKRYLAPL